MAALEEVSLIGEQAWVGAEKLNLTQAAELKEWFARLLWIWVLENGERRVMLKLWFIRKSWKIKDLHEVFELLLGPKPIFIVTE